MGKKEAKGHGEARSKWTEKEWEQLYKEMSDIRDRMRSKLIALTEQLSAEQMRRARAENRLDACLAAMCHLNWAQAEAADKLHHLMSWKEDKVELAG